MDRSRRLEDLHASLLKSARRWTRDSNAAEDLVQDTWLAMLQGTAPIPARPSRSWLRCLLRNKGIDSIRTRTRRPEIASLAGDELADETPIERAEERELTRLLWQRLERLDAPYREVLYARYVEGLAPSEIARRDALPVETVRTRTRRGLQRLREQLSAQASS